MNKVEKTTIKWALVLAGMTLTGSVILTYTDYPVIGFVLLNSYLLSVGVLGFGKTSKCDRKIWKMIKRPFLP